jgi:hypothetical protein
MSQQIEEYYNYGEEAREVRPTLNMYNNANRDQKSLESY